MTAHGKDWTTEESQRLIEMIRDGLPTQYIARSMKRSMLSLYSHLSKQNVSIRDTRDDLFKVRSPNKVGELFQVSYSVVALWIREGFLKTKRYVSRGKGRSRAYQLINDFDLEEFLRCVEAWPSWEPGNITDPDWRGLAQEIRDTAGWHWLSVGDIAQLYHVSKATAGDWMYTKKLPSQLLCHKRYVKSTDLEGFVLPSEEYLRHNAGHVCELCGKEFISKKGRAQHMPSCRKKRGMV